MSVSRTDTVERRNFIAAAGRFRFCAEVKLHGFPSIASLRLQTEARRWLITAMDHAILAATVFRDAILDSVFLPLHLFEQFRVARIVSIGHQITRAFPAANIARRDS